MEIRRAREEDLKGIMHVIEKAFGEEKGKETATLVNDLFNDETAKPSLSVVAIKEEKVVGHILFTKAEIEPCNEDISVSLLAPLAIVPEHQSKGLGKKLIQKGLTLLKEAGVKLVFVLGHPEYYPRCGFSPAGVQGYEAPYHIPEKDADAWMVQELQSGVIGSIEGKVVCAKALDNPKYWRE